MKIINQLAKCIIKWGEDNIDYFIWRNTNSLYEIIVAEILLIRTSAGQVENVYIDFIKEFPNFSTLNDAKLEKVKASINSLGLVWRAEILKKMANYIITNNLFYKDDLSIDDLKMIPGVGEYIANAIYTFYFKKRAYLVDSNTLRFFNRFYNKKFDKNYRRNKELTKMIENIVPKTDENAVKFNIAFLDFMRKVCTPTNPNCESCILNNKCKYYKNK